MLSVTLDQYVSIPPHANTAVALWTVATHCLDIRTPDDHDPVPVARFSPILALTSPGPRFGKTTVLTLLSKLVHRPLSTANITSAALFKVMHESQPTMLIDEADSFMRSSSELRNILNSGHSRDLAYVVRSTSSGPRK
ncbi:MAG TPA: hypothetical protein VMM27_06375, partial [Casimicrobiaceae bacterium]|nr:hypothetical protein [Casimicrobiaceae bacterium]